MTGGSERLVDVGVDERATVHTERCEDVGPDELLEARSGYLGDHVTERVKGHVAVAPALARCPQELLRRHLADVSLRRAFVGLGFVPLVVPNVGHARGVVEHLADGDVAKPLVGKAEVGKVLEHWGIEVQPSLLDQLHDCSGDERLRDRREVENMFGSKLFVVADLPEAESPHIDHLSVAYNSRGQSGYVLRPDLLSKI